MKLAAIVLAAGAGVAFGQTYIMGVDSGSDAIHLFDANDGTLVQQTFIDLVPFDGGTPKHAIQVGNEIWVSDQIRDNIQRFDLAGAHLGTISGGLDNIKGMEVVGNQVWVSNAGSNNDAPGNSIVFIDIATQTISGSVATNGSLFDMINFNGQVLGSNITNESLELYDLGGNYVGDFHTSDGVSSIDFPQQLALRANGNVLAGGFSTPSGVFEFDPFGNSLGIVAGQDLGVRGVIELGNGSIMWSNGAGFFVGSDSVFAGGSGQYLSLLVIPTPSGLAVIGLAGLVGARRRR